MTYTAVQVLPIPGHAQARTALGLLLASHTSCMLFLPLGTLVLALFPQAGRLALYGGYMLPTVLALAALVWAKLARRRGYPRGIGPVGHFSAATRDGAWACVVVAMLVIVDIHPHGFATLLVREAVMNGTWPEAQEAVHDWLVGYPAPRGPADDVYAWASLLAVYGFAVLTLRGTWSMVRLMQGRPVRPALMGPRFTVLDIWKHIQGS
jgi:hypothetical protein